MLQPRHSGAVSLVSAWLPESFDYEWVRCDCMLPEYDNVEHVYFAPMPPDALAGEVVLGANCGMGHYAPNWRDQRVCRPELLSSGANDRAAVTLVGQEELHCFWADLCYWIFRPATLDVIKLLVVPQHCFDPNKDMRNLSERLKLDDSPLAYLCHSRDDWPRFFRLLLHTVSALCQAYSRLPRSLMHWQAQETSITVYWPLAWLAGALERRDTGGRAQDIALTFDRGHWLILMIADAFDCLTTPIKKQYARRQMKEWLANYGFGGMFSDDAPCRIAVARWPHPANGVQE